MLDSRHFNNLQVTWRHLTRGGAKHRTRFQAFRRKPPRNPLRTAARYSGTTHTQFEVPNQRWHRIAYGVPE